jgi:hypothetical protein
MASTAAKGRGAGQVADEDVSTIFAMQELDELGLRWMDRRILAALLGRPRFRKVTASCALREHPRHLHWFEVAVPEDHTGSPRWLRRGATR